MVNSSFSNIPLIIFQLDILNNAAIDPNMVQLKNILERDAIVAAPKHFHAPEKPCELVHSILRVKSRLIHPKPIPVAAVEETQKDYVCFEGTSPSDSPNRRSATPQPVKRASIRLKGITNTNAGDTTASDSPVGLLKKTSHSYFSKYSDDTVILNPCLSKQADVVLRYLSKKTKFTIDGKVMIQKWIREMKLNMDEDGILNEKDLPVPVVKPFYLQKLEKVFLKMRRRE